MDNRNVIFRQFQIPIVRSTIKENERIIQSSVFSPRSDWRKEDQSKTASEYRIQSDTMQVAAYQKLYEQECPGNSTW